VSNDPIDLLASVDEVILVVRAGRTTVKSIEDTMGLLEMHHAPILGVVLIGTLATREMYAYYQSYYRQADANDAPAEPSSGDGQPDSVNETGATQEREDRAEAPSHARSTDEQHPEPLRQFPDPPRQFPDPPQQFPDPPQQYLPPPPMPPPYGQAGSA
jgi:hypothetical protein